jgi:hypothetical protein
MKRMTRGHSNTPAPMIDHCARIEIRPTARARPSFGGKVVPAAFVDQVI